MLVILAADAPQEFVDAIVGKATARGFTAQASRGDEQTLVALSGRGDPDGIANDLAGAPGVELLPLQAGRVYRTRRRHRALVGWLAAALGLLFALAWMLPVLGYLAPPAHPLSGEEYSRQQSVKGFADDSARTLHVKGQPVLLIHHGNEHYFAVSGRCTYMKDSRLEWDPARAQIVCPNHGCVFDVFGNVLHGPASIPLQRFVVERAGDRVLVAPENP
jgi:nitrite reductase/ring-hydroxylating ferredoxin subunit